MVKKTAKPIQKSKKLAAVKPLIKRLAMKQPLGKIVPLSKTL